MNNQAGQEYNVGQVAELAGVSIRTLRHYDEIGLLRPAQRSHAGYRKYQGDDLERLEQILYYRDLGFGLDEIKALVQDPRADAAKHLRNQHQILEDRIARLNRMLESVERAMEANRMGIQLTPEERFEMFGDEDPEQYAEEAEQRWGETDAYKESQRRVSKYTKKDWLEMKAESAQLGADLSAAMTAGLPVDSPEVMALAERHRQQISKWFYDCSYEIQAGLAEMYVADPRFTEYYDSQQPGLAQYLHDAILANAIDKS